MLEKVFIAWGGNESLANAVRDKLAKETPARFNGVVGGGIPKNAFVTQQVFDQIKQCTYAIILVQRDPETSEFRCNLMFELGYLLKKYENHAYQMNIFLINEESKDLPSDLHGIWNKEIVSDEKNDDELAEEIVKLFLEKNTSPITIDKMKKLTGWPETLRILKKYQDEPFFSEKELAHYLLHSIEACYYCMDEKSLQDFIQSIEPATNELQTTIRIVKSNFDLFKESGGLSKPIRFEYFDTFLNSFDVDDFDFTKSDENLHLWLRYFCFNRLALSYMLIARNDDSVNSDQIKENCEKAKKYAEDAREILEDILLKFPGEKSYIMLYKGYVSRDLYKIHSILNNTVEKLEYAREAKEIRGKFRQLFPKDSDLRKRFDEEYYLSCCELLLCTKSQDEIADLDRLLAEYVYRADREDEEDRRHIVSKQIHELYGEYKNRNCYD